MLTWVPEKRATAQEMLEHPWLKTPGTYDYKYSDREYEVMMLKKQMEGSNTNARVVVENRQDMNTVIESDPE